MRILIISENKALAGGIEQQLQIAADQKPGNRNRLQRRNWRRIRGIGNL